MVLRTVHTRCLLLSLLSLVTGGCGKLLGPKTGGDPIPAYPDGPAGLQAMFTDVLAAAKADDRARVHDLFQSLKMTRPELEALFGGPRAAELAQPYDEMMGSLIHRGAVEIVGVVYEKKYDTVEVFPVALDLADGQAHDGGVGSVRAEDVPLARALVSPPPIYAVRFKKAGEALGTRYDFFFYRDGRWRTGNQLGKLIAKQNAKKERAEHPAAAPAPGPTEAPTRAPQ